jgi:hypothetical protein
MREKSESSPSPLCRRFDQGAASHAVPITRAVGASWSASRPENSADVCESLALRLDREHLEIRYSASANDLTIDTNQRLPLMLLVTESLNFRFPC